MNWYDKFKIDKVLLNSKVTKESQSILDIFLNNDGILQNIEIVDPQYDNAVTELYEVWKHGKRVSDKTFKVQGSNRSVSIMEKQGLVKQIGDKITVTSKGVDALKVMILGDDYSPLDNKRREDRLTYKQASANIKKKKHQRHKRK
jgi:hypothetical protein